MHNAMPTSAPIVGTVVMSDARCFLHPMVAETCMLVAVRRRGGQERLSTPPCTMLW